MRNLETMIGRNISHYKILEEIGRGGMGVVYKAEDIKLKRTVALKFLSPMVVGSEEEKTRFYHEAQAAAALDDSNICAVHEIEEWEEPQGGKQTFIVMAYVEGQSLKEKIASGPLKITEAVAIAIQIAQGLQAAHEKGIVHRDVKPANILLTTRGQVRITDFGLAKLAGRTKVTQTGTTLGTAAYMSPEQARGEPVDQRTDIWSLGVVLYEMLTGQLPFKGEYEQAILYSIMNDDPEPPTALRSGVPMELERIVLKALAKNPDERYQHVDDLLTDLRRVQIQTEKHPSFKQSEKRFTPKKRDRKKFFVLSFFVFMLLLSVLFIFRRKLMSPGNTVQDLQNGWWQNSIAVLPFEDLSPQKDQEYFCDGMTDDIITKLSNIRELKVINRTSVLRYRNTTKDIKQIGEELGVANILQGSLRREGKRVRINAQLVKVDNGFNLWAKSFDFKIEDLFAVQEEVSRAIARALKVKFSPQTLAGFDTRRSTDLDFYEYQLKASYFVNRFLASRREQDFQKALKMIHKMLAIDSTDARPYVWLGWCYENHYTVSGNPEDQKKVLDFGRIAYRLDPQMAEANGAMGWIHFEKKDYAKAFQFYSKALQIKSNMSPINHVVGIFYYYLGLFEQAVVYFRRASALDPFFLYSTLLLADSYRNLAQFDQATTYYHKALEIAPDNPTANLRYADLLIRTRNFREAEEVIRRVETKQPTYPLLPYYRALLFAARGEKEQALAQMKNPPAEVYALLGLKDQAIQYIAKHKEESSYQYLSLLHNPYFDSLRGDSRFEQIVAGQKKVYQKRVELYGKLVVENL
ncbi:MAG: tetratricopeptide repeat protein [Calditrichaeota bacterium]|nr:MAG: tetratricopeptide repeat protein [Calditrichota bacterium]